MATGFVGLGCNCCGGSVDCNDCEIPNPLPLTDANETIGLFQISSTTWKGSYYLTMDSGVVVDIDGFGSCYWSGTSSSGPVTICYTVVCNGDGTVTVTRSWSAVSTRFTDEWIAVQDAATPDPTSLNPCPTSPGFFCQPQRIHTDLAVLTSTPSDCFHWSGVPSADPDNKTDDPVGGTVSLG